MGFGLGVGFFVGLGFCFFFRVWIVGFCWIRILVFSLGFGLLVFVGFGF